MLLERLEGEFMSTDDLHAKKALRTLHCIGKIHGNVNRHNIIVDRSKKLAQLLDFEHAAPYEKA